MQKVCLSECMSILSIVGKWVGHYALFPATYFENIPLKEYREKRIFFGGVVTKTHQEPILTLFLH